jgi:hypothetical protein
LSQLHSLKRRAGVAEEGLRPAHLRMNDVNERKREQFEEAEREYEGGHRMFARLSQRNEQMWKKIIKIKT